MGWGTKMPTNYERLMTLRAEAGDRRKPHLNFLGTFFDVATKGHDHVTKYLEKLRDPGHIARAKEDLEWFESQIEEAKADPTSPLFYMSLPNNGQIYKRTGEGQMVPVYMTAPRFHGLFTYENTRPYSDLGKMCIPGSGDRPEWSWLKPVPEDAELWYIRLDNNLMVRV